MVITRFVDQLLESKFDKNFREFRNIFGFCRLSVVELSSFSDLRTHCNCMSNITLEGDGKNFDHCCLKIYQWLQELAQDQRKLDKLVNDKDSDPVMQFFRKYRERAGKCFNSGTFEPPRTDTLLATNVQSNMGLLVICTVAMMHPIIGD